VTLHVAHVIDGLALGGAERMLVELANRTVGDGHRASVCVTRSDVTLAPRLDPRIELRVLGRRARLELRPLAQLAGWLRAGRVDVVHCHGRSSFSLVAVLRATGAWPGPVVLHDHLGVQLHPSVPPWFRLARRALAAYVAVDPTQLAWAARAGIPAARRHVIPNAIDLAALAAQRLTGPPLPAAAPIDDVMPGAPAPVGDGARVPPVHAVALPAPPRVAGTRVAAPAAARLIFVGGLRSDKAVDVLLDALVRVTAPAILYLVGGDADPAYAARCRARAARPDLAGRVVFLGARADALPLAATADLAVHPARSESGPLVLAEYAALGLPFVATRVGGIAVALAAAGAGRFVAPDDAAALAAAIDEVLALPAPARRQLGLAAGALARARFDLSAVMPRWYALYAELAR
jgi:glycosyltransferase involved in cell wall biosynthesis